jgi:RNA polymerase sigma-70 factor (ECF subfamily)
VRRFLNRLAGADAADDLAQEVFIKAWRMRGAWRHDGPYGAWLMRIAWTGFLSFHRARGRALNRDQAAYEPERQALHDPDAAIDLARAMSSLDERERAAAQLCLAEGFSHSEAAEILQLPLGTLKSMVARARTRLVAALETKNVG